MELSFANREIALSRNLARAIENNIESMPEDVKQAYYQLFELYQQQIEQGIS